MENKVKTPSPSLGADPLNPADKVDVHAQLTGRARIVPRDCSCLGVQMATAVPRWRGLHSALVDPSPAAVVNHALTHIHLPFPPSRDHIFTRELAGKQSSSERHMAGCYWDTSPGPQAEQHHKQPSGLTVGRRSWSVPSPCCYKTRIISILTAQFTVLDRSEL